MSTRVSRVINAMRDAAAELVAASVDRNPSKLVDALIRCSDILAIPQLSAVERLAYSRLTRLDDALGIARRTQTDLEQGRKLLDVAAHLAFCARSRAQYRERIDLVKSVKSYLSDAGLDLSALAPSLSAMDAHRLRKYVRELLCPAWAVDGDSLFLAAQIGRELIAAGHDPEPVRELPDETPSVKEQDLELQ